MVRTDLTDAIAAGVVHAGASVIRVVRQPAAPSALATPPARLPCAPYEIARAPRARRIAPAAGDHR